MAFRSQHSEISDGIPKMPCRDTEAEPSSEGLAL